MPFQKPPRKKNTNDLSVYGTHPVLEAIQAGKDINKVLVMRGAGSDGINEILNLCRHRSIPAQFVPKEKFSSFASKNHQGVVAFLSPVAYQHIEDILPGLFERGELPFLLILDRVTDVRNLGAIARTAFCAGVHALIIPAADNAPVNDDAVKTSAGALMHIAVCREKNLKSTLEFLNQSGVATIACTEKASDNLQQTDFTLPVAIVMGNEETGISNELLRKCTGLAKIPMEMGVQSLNVSVAAGIALYEVLRQRQQI